jgi:pilus assembly protein CpaB
MLALGCGLVAFIGVTQVLAKRRAVFVANTDVGLGDLLTSQMINLEPWPKDKIPPGAVTRLEDIEGHRVRTRLYAGEPILANKLMGKGANDQGATSLIPKNYRVVPVRVDATSSGSNLIQPGDRVDVMIYLTRAPDRGIPETVTRTILQDIKVFAVDAIVNLEKEKDASRPINARSISLLVTPDQAAKVMLAEKMGTLLLVMRSPEDDSLSAVAQARPSELFGESTKSNRAKDSGESETPKDSDKKKSSDGLGSFLKSLQTQVHTPSVTHTPETWTMRKIDPDGAIEETQFELESNSAADAASGHWKATGASATSTGTSGGKSTSTATSIPIPGAAASGTNSAATGTSQKSGEGTESKATMEPEGSATPNTSSKGAATSEDEEEDAAPPKKIEG